MCKVIYGYQDLENEIRKYYILDPTGYENYKRKLAFDLNFKLQRENSEKIRNLYFTIFELASVMRELNFRMINPTYVLPSIIDKINTTLRLSYKDGEITLLNPVTIETKTEFEEEENTTLTLDLHDLTGIRNFFLKAKVSLHDKRLIAELNISLKIESKGISREVDKDEINKLLQVTAREVNQKSLISQSQLDEIAENLIESMIDPILQREKEKIQKSTEIYDFAYIPANRSLLLNVSESALTNEEIAQLFSERCVYAINRIKKGIKNFKSYLSSEVKVINGVLYWKDISAYNAPPSIRSLIVIDSIISTLKERSLIVIEYPEEYLTEEEVEDIARKLKELNANHEIIVITGSKKVKEVCEK